ncbi:putative AMP-activated kinase, glycogen-binding protein [Dioscorea sansibarensis]
MALCHLSFFPFPPRTNLCASLSFLKRDVRQFPLQGSTPTACNARKSSESGKESRAVKSNEELRSELREFMSALGLPDDHVPSTKELTDHGRKDLANIVRRRGYKVIADLLKNSTAKNGNKLGSAENHVSGDSSKEEISGNKETTIQESAECTSESIMPPIEACMKTPNGSIALYTYASDSKDPISSIESLRTKAAKFILTGELDNLDENGMLASEHALPLVAEQSLDRGDITSCDDLAVTNSDANFTPEMTDERQNQAEIDRLKDLLHRKELELSHLKEQIEKEKAALSFLEAKVSTEISKAEEIISAKDIELRAAEETLSGLKEVHIEYWAIAETIEVAGSFNGWQHHIIMDLDPSSDMEEPTSRKSQCWSTILWLYPGNYEIKFIVDGQWRIDSKLDVINSGGITNNILRVDR